MRTYAGQPMSFADAYLVRMAEVHPECAFVTTDDEPLDLRLPND